MGIEDVSKGPKNIERLTEKELIQRLHDQLALIYDRVFLTGDWKGEFAHKEDRVRVNIFEDPAVDDANVLADALEEFLNDIVATLPKAIKPEDIYDTQEKHDANRLVFAETLKYVRDILRQSQKDIGTREHVDMAKCIDENIHYFRDFSVQNVRGMPGGIMQSAKVAEADEMRALAGLRRVNNRLQDIFESTGWRSSHNGGSKAV